MHFQAENTALITGIRLVERAISSNNPLQILGGIHLEADNGHLTLTANDLEISIQTKIECTSFVSGSAVLDGKLLSALVRRLPQGNVIFEKRDTQVIISAGTTEFTLN